MLDKKDDPKVSRLYKAQRDSAKLDAMIIELGLGLG
jgi:hypothetical protein